MIEKLPIADPNFWKERLERARYMNAGAIHPAIYDTSYSNWMEIQRVHGEILPRLLHPYRGVKLLDAGCGYGALYELLPEGINYAGVDISPDFLEEARRLLPENSSRRFLRADLRDLPFPDDSFDIAVCRSIDGMVKDNMGVNAWRKMEAELLRVANRLVLLNYSQPDLFTVIDSWDRVDQNVVRTVETVGGRLSYRNGMDGTVELYDLLVSEEHRRQGVASRLISKVISETYGTVYAFCRNSNHAIRAVYEKLGFTIHDIPGFYRGEDGTMAVKEFLKHVGESHASRDG